MASHITQSTSPMNVFELAMDMLADGRIDVAPIITHTFAATDFAEAYRMASHYEDGIIKTMIVWNENGVDAPSTNTIRAGTQDGGGGGGVSAAGAAGESASYSAPSLRVCAPCTYQPTKL